MQFEKEKNLCPLNYCNTTRKGGIDDESTVWMNGEMI